VEDESLAGLFSPQS